MNGRNRQICLIVEYDGGAYHGWQFQANNLSIQEVLEDAVRRITGERVRVIGAGRTDAGVHALAQVAAFFTASALPGGDFTRALNAVLPRDIRILSSLEVSPDFHPQFDARGKTYLYLVLNRPLPSALLVRRCWHVSRPLDVGIMREAASCLVGRHDFSAFRSASCSARETVRTLSRADVTRENSLVEFRFEGNGFLKNMVGNIVGTLIDAGKGLYPPSRVAEILSSGDRRLAGPCAPPCGLYLVRVNY